MANVRPQRRSKFTRVDDNVEDEPVFFKNEEANRQFSFDGDYDQMHNQSFTNGVGGKPTPKETKIKGASVSDLESLVKTLASLQFTTKGKVDSDGNVEIVFCSPEPIVVEEKPEPKVQLVHVSDKPEIQEKGSRRAHRHKERKKIMYFSK
jgi:hypothetical protein